MRWPMQATKATARRQRASRVVATLQLFATTFVMHAMVGRYFRQLKMPRPDAYTAHDEEVLDSLPAEGTDRRSKPRSRHSERSRENRARRSGAEPRGPHKTRAAKAP